MIEECRVNNVLSFGDSEIVVLYMRNLNEPCLVPMIVNMEQGSAPEWVSLTSLDDLYEKVKSYLKAFHSLRTPSSVTAVQRNGLRKTGLITTSTSGVSQEGSVSMIRTRSLLTLYQ